MTDPLHQSIDAACVMSVLALAAWMMLACGRLSLAVTPFAAIGTATSVFAAKSGLGAPLAIAAGVAAAGLTAYVLGFLIARLDTVRFTVATFALVAPLTLTGFSIQQIEPGNALRVAPWVIPSLAFAAVVGSWRLQRSRSGRALRSAAVDERAAASAGIDVLHVRQLAFTGSGALAGLAGAMSLAAGGAASHAIGGSIDAIVLPVAAATIGGGANFVFTVIASIAIGLVPTSIYGTADARGIVGAALMLLTMLVAPAGLPSLFGAFSRRPANRPQVQTR